MKVIIKKIIDVLMTPIIKYLHTHPYIHGDSRRVHIASGVALVNTTLNTASGDIFIGSDTIFGHNCMLLTGRHEFVEGKRKKLQNLGADTPATGYDIKIGKGCWIASGAIIIGGVEVGDHCIVAAGAVVTKSIPSNSMAFGVPALVKKMDM